MIRRDFDEAFLREVIDSSEPDRLYVCGPDRMSKSIK
jgi:NAD(P)H-flavin reductase